MSEFTPEVLRVRAVGRVVPMPPRSALVGATPASVSLGMGSLQCLLSLSPGLCGDPDLGYGDRLPVPRAGAILCIPGSPRGCLVFLHRAACPSRIV